MANLIIGGHVDHGEYKSAGDDDNEVYCNQQHSCRDLKLPQMPVSLINAAAIYTDNYGILGKANIVKLCVLCLSLVSLCLSLRLKDTD